MAISVISGAKIVELLGEPKGCPITMTVSNATAIGKGSLLKLSDPRTAAQGTARTDKFAGIAAADKEASDGSTKLAVWTKGIFDLPIVNAVTAGVLVSMSGANQIDLAAATDVENGLVVGKALESFAGGSEEFIMVAVGMY